MLVRSSAALLAACLLAAPATADESFRWSAYRAMSADPVDTIHTGSVGTPSPAARLSPAPRAQGLIVPGRQAATTSAVSVDESALRYYARQNNLERVETEIRRLKTLYPAWQPPASLSELLQDNEDEQALWHLFGDDRLEELRRDIARRMAEQPGWKPSADLLAKLAAKESRRRLINASEAKQWHAVLRVAANEPGIIVAEDIDILWRVAEAYGETEAPDKAFEIYRDILNGSAGPKERLATVQKAIFRLDPARVDALIALGRANPDGTGEFDVVGLDRLRARVVAVVSGKKADALTKAEIGDFEAAARGNGSAADAGLLGWYHYQRKDWAAARSWFDLGREHGGDEKLIEGAILARRMAGDQLAAEDLAHRLSEGSDRIADLYVGMVAETLSAPKPGTIAGDRLARYGAVVEARHAANGAEALGWYHYNNGTAAAARPWFEKAMAWQASDSRALGMALALRSAGARGELAAFVAANKDLYPRIAELPAMSASGTAARKSRTDPVVAAYKAKKYTQCLGLLDAREGKGSLRPQDQLMKGWCLLGAKRPREAALAFDKAAAGTGQVRKDAVYGKSLAHLRVGETGQGERAADSTALSGAREAEITAEVLTQRAIAAFDVAAYRKVLWLLNQRRKSAQEPRNLTMLRGWSHYHLGDLVTARKIFRSVDMQLSTQSSRAGLMAIDNRLASHLRQQ